MNQQLLDTIVAVLIRRGLTYLGIAVGGASGIPDEAVMKLAAAAVSLALMVGNEVYQARKLHQTQKQQGGVMPPAK